MTARVLWLGSIFLAPVECAQRVSFGFVGGTGLTANFPATDVSTPAQFENPPNRFQFRTGPRSFIAGAAVETTLFGPLSLRLDVLHRPMKNRVIFDEFLPGGTTRGTDYVLTAVRAWQFPVLLKYELPANGRYRPFIEGGLSFRTQEDATATEPSQFGGSFGAGVSFRFGKLRVAPQLRYTRWQREFIAPKYSTKPDQVEFLTTLSYGTDSGSRQVGGHRVRPGAVLGSPLTSGLGERGWRYLAGLSVEMDLTRKVSLEMNGLFRPMRIRRPRETRFVVLTWQLPVLVKYTAPRPGWSPFFEAGPSFRLSGNLNGYNPSRLGATIGAGVSKEFGGFRVAPAIRYTRWREDSVGRVFSAATNPNSVDVVFGLSF